MRATMKSSLTEPGPVLASAPGWPLVLYFHHIAFNGAHYTILSPPLFRTALETILEFYGQPIDPQRTADVTAGYGGQPSFLLTFDDGYLDNLHYAAPILNDYGIKAVFFVVTGEVDRASSQAAPGRAARDHAAYLTWDELGELRNAGHLIANHTVSHLRLPSCPPDEQIAQVRDADRMLRIHTGYSARLVAYPYGELPTTHALLPDEFGFATVRVPPRPWRQDTRAEPHAIRRTYLPAHSAAQWRPLCVAWRSQWFG